jgi:hypothetical protein
MFKLNDHFFFLALFPEAYLHFETFSHALLRARVVFQWMVGLHTAVADNNRTYSVTQQQKNITARSMVLLRELYVINCY